MQRWRTGLGAALLVLWAAAACPSEDVREEAVRPLAPGKLARGAFLVAARHLSDPNFARSVVFLLEYEPSGAVGLVINRRTPIGVDTWLDDLPAGARPIPRLHFGGPVQQRGLWFLSDVGIGEDPRRVVAGVYVSRDRRDLEALLTRDPEHAAVRVYAGYAGWAPGQLETELARDDWLVLQGDPGPVFSSEPDLLWERLFDVANARWVRAPRTPSGPEAEPSPAAQRVARGLVGLVLRSGG